MTRLKIKHSVSSTTTFNFSVIRSQNEGISVWKSLSVLYLSSTLYIYIYSFYIMACTHIYIYIYIYTYTSRSTFSILRKQLHTQLQYCYFQGVSVTFFGGAT